MRRRDRIFGLGKSLFEVVRGAKPPPDVAPVETTAAARAAYQPPKRDDAESRVDTGDVWAVRYAIDPQGIPLLVNHWATWCDGCLEEMPLLVRLYKAHGERVRFQGVAWEGFTSPHDVDGQRAAVDASAREFGAAWRHMLYTGTPDELFAGLLLADTVIPQTQVLDGEGKVLFAKTGALSERDTDQIDAIFRAFAS